MRFRLDFAAWNLSVRISRLQSFGIFRSETPGRLALAGWDFRLGFVAWDFSFKIVRFESSDWNLSLEIFGLGTFA